MADPLRLQIINRHKANLEARFMRDVDDLNFKGISRAVATSKPAAQRPWATIVAADELPGAKDTRGRERLFDLHTVIDLKCGKQDELLVQIERYAAAVIMVLEGDIQMGTLANIVDDIRREDFVTAPDSAEGGTVITARVSYRHPRTDATAGY